MKNRKPYTRARNVCAVLDTPDGLVYVGDVVIVLPDGTEIPVAEECSRSPYRTLTPKRRRRPAPKKAAPNVVGKVKLSERDLARFQGVSR